MAVLRAQVAGAAVLLVAVVVVMTGCAVVPASTPGAGGTAPSGGAAAPPSGGAASPPPTVEVDGEILHHSGDLPFQDVVLDETDARTLVVQVVELPRKSRFPACSFEDTRVLVRESATEVVVRLAAYATRPTHTPVLCADGLMASIPVRVELQQPLGDRRLIDAADGAPHPALDPAMVPIPSVRLDAEDLQRIAFEERTGVAWRRWQGSDDGSEPYRDLWVMVGEADAVDARAPVPSRTSRTVEIDGADARVWHGGGPLDVVVVRWLLADGRRIEVRSITEKGTPGTVERALRIARSTR